MDGTGMISVAEAGKRLYGCSRAESYEKYRRGEIPGVRVGRRIYVPVPAIERLLHEQSEAALAALEERRAARLRHG